MVKRMKPRIQSVRNRRYSYKCSRLIAGDWIGFGKTPEEAWSNWYAQNIAADEFNLAA